MPRYKACCKQKGIAAKLKCSVTVQAGQFFDRINQIFSLFCYQILKILLILSKFAFRLKSYVQP